MPIRNTLKIALKAIRRNKVRSGLTMLGVIIGVASVIAMIALGSGARASIDQQIQSQGTNVIYVSAGSFGRGPGAVRGGSGSITTLTLEDARAIANEVPTVALVSPMVRGRAQVVAGNQNWNTQMEGGNEDYITIRNWTLQSGENFTARDILLADKVGAARIERGEDPVPRLGSGRPDRPRPEPALPRPRRADPQGPGPVRPGPGRRHRRALHHPAEEAARHHPPEPDHGLGPELRRRRADRGARSPACCASATAPPAPRTTTSRCARWRRWRPRGWRWRTP